jgi:glycosyltransferase involved in cell wall biosynthesis
MNALRLAIVSTHPIQYYAPIFQALARSSSLLPRVFYTWSQTSGQPVADPGFGRMVTWDIPLLDGYEYQFVANEASRPGTDRYSGIHNPDLVPEIERWRPDALLVFGWNSRSHLALLRHFKGRVPVFFRGDSTLLDRQSGARSLLRRVFLNWVYRHIDVAIAVGSNNIDYYRWCGLRENRIAYAPHAVDTSRFSDAGGAHELRALQWRRELGIAIDARVLLFAGKFQPKKDPLLLLEAFLDCAQPGHLVLAGSGVMEETLRSRAGTHPAIHFLPFQNQQAMPSLYRLADVFVLPSRGPGETWGLALNEAMASGRPAIASDRVGGARDLIVDGETGWVFPAGAGQSLAAILRRALTCDATDLKEMGEKARSRSNLWSIEAAALGIERAVLEFASSSTTKKRHTARA